MKITALSLRSYADGKTAICINCELHNQKEVDALIVWLNSTRATTHNWNASITKESTNVIDIEPRSREERKGKGRS
jgi:hypothetical protein